MIVASPGHTHLIFMDLPDVMLNGNGSASCSHTNIKYPKASGQSLVTVNFLISAKKSLYRYLEKNSASAYLMSRQ